MFSRTFWVMMCSIIVAAYRVGGIKSTGNNGGISGGGDKDKSGLCLALTSTVCDLPLEVQLLSFNTALHFANTFGYTLVKSIPKRNQEECPLFASLFDIKSFALHVASIVPSFRANCDERLLIPADQMCPSETYVDKRTDRVTIVWSKNTSNVWCRVPEYTFRGESDRRCLPGHMSVSFMSVQKLTLKLLLGNKLLPSSRNERFESFLFSLSIKSSYYSVHEFNSLLLKKDYYYYYYYYL
jgi:hypothetical protein